MQDTNDIAAYSLTAPPQNARARPLLISSPHSGAYYPPEFLAASRLDARDIRQSEDMFVADLFDGAARAGASLLAANYPRAYLDLNRAPNELEQELFEDTLPDYINRHSPRATSGLGTVPRLVAENKPIYNGKLKFAEAQARIEKIYHPFHRAIDKQLTTMHASHGFAILLDAHSMPSQAIRRGQHRPSRPAVDFVLGNQHGRACANALTDWVHTFLTTRGYIVAMNQPYAGGYITGHYGRPAICHHALQIEINRDIYMTEARHQKHAGFEHLRADLLSLVHALADALPHLEAQFMDTHEHNNLNRPAAE